MKENCHYCWPIKRKSHFFLHIDYYVSNLILWPFSRRKFKKPNAARTKKFPQNLGWGLILELLAFMRFVSFEDTPNEQGLFNRSLIFFQEAKKRGIDIRSVKFLQKQMNEFKFRYQGKNYYYEGIPLTLKSVSLSMDDKHIAKAELNKQGVPVAKGKLCKNLNQAMDVYKQHGYPLVVKPNNGSLSHHVTCNINSEDKLIEAVNIARKYCPDFIVERHINGKLFRATVIGKKKVYVCEKVKANIIGDGLSTVEELILEKNGRHKRGGTHQKNTTLHRIPVDNNLKKTIAIKGLTLKSIIAKNKVVCLQDKFILSQGCDIIGHTTNTHPDNRKLFFDIASFLDADLLGIDFICPDIRQSYKSQQTAVLELNSLPYIDMHQYPSHGEPDNVAEEVWDMILENI